MPFYNQLPLEQQEYAAAYLWEMLLEYLPGSTSVATVNAALDALNPYVQPDRAIILSQQDQERVLDWILSKQ